METDFSKIFPGAGPFIDGLPVNFPIIDQMQSVYAPFGALHLVGLALLGGCVLILNLRFLGAGLTEEAPSTIERNLRPWMIAGFCIVFGTGVVIGILNASKLFYSPAFYVKMVALLAAAIFSFYVTNNVAKNEGTVTRPAKIAAAIAGLIWLYGLGTFSMTTGVNPGAFHMLTAAFAILLLFGTRTRLIAGIGVAAIMIIGAIYTYGFVGVDKDTLGFFAATKLFVAIAGVFVTALILYEIFTGKAEPKSPVARLIALFSILAWVTVAAGGRWIGFS